MLEFIRTRLRSFRYAGRGIRIVLQTEVNARLHALATLLVLAAGFYFRIERGEWLAVALAVAAVWSAEAINTAFEALCDVASTEFHPQVERAKDVAAGAVLVSSIGALVVGVIVFGRRVLALFGA